jgi:hypothetical protein
VNTPWGVCAEAGEDAAKHKISAGRNLLAMRGHIGDIVAIFT